MEAAVDSLKAPFGPPLQFQHRAGGLAYHVFNHDSTETVLLLHCTGTGAPEWDIVIPHFSKQYHLLVPDLPLHNQSAGYNRVDNLAWTPFKPYLPHIIYAAESLVTKVPKAWIDGVDHTADTATPLTFDHFEKIWALVNGDDMRHEPWKVRTLLVAATKDRLIATSDSIKDARDAALRGQQENPVSKAVQNRSMRHAWTRQDPKLFVETVMCWIENRALPDGFEPI